MKHLLDLTDQEIDEMSDGEFNSIAWQCNITPPAWKIAKVRALAREILEGRWDLFSKE